LVGGQAHQEVQMDRDSGTPRHVGQHGTLVDPGFLLSPTLPSSPEIAQVAVALGVSPVQAIGLVVGVFCGVRQYRSEWRRLALWHIPAQTVERWAGWDGEPGRFMAVFKEVFCTDRERPDAIDTWAARVPRGRRVVVREVEAAR
jgi:hypothetical protein